MHYMPKCGINKIIFLLISLICFDTGAQVFASDSITFTTNTSDNSTNDKTTPNNRKQISTNVYQEIDLSKFSKKNHGHNGSAITSGTIKNKFIPNLIARKTDLKKFEKIGHKHNGKEIISGIIKECFIDSSLTRDKELTNALSQKANVIHQHDDHYASILTVDQLIERISTLEKRINTLETLLENVSKVGNNLVFSGINVKIVNGSNKTDGVVNGVGNLIIGYNEKRAPDVKTVRTGSHNLIIGNKHSYSSYGGVAVGAYNTISAPYSSCTGGYGNTAEEKYSTVSGGQFNKATGKYATVSGGMTRTASKKNSWQAGNYSAER